MKAPKYPILDEIKVPQQVLENWQVTANLLAEITGIPAALIMRVHAREIEVFISSDSAGNVYHQGEKMPLDTGLYCETVMGTQRELLVPNALKDPVWNHNPDVELGMISYFGLPLTWPTGEIFGTICILDQQENAHSERTRHLMERIRDSIQFGLQILYNASAERMQAEEELRRAHEALNLRVQEQTNELASANASLLAEITERKQTENILRMRLKLLERSFTHSMEELLVATLDQAEALTDSQVGFYHFLGEDQKTLLLQAWSTHTSHKMCKAEGKGRHYDVDEAGVWVDCIRQRRPVIHNDYAVLPNRKGLPPGHAPVIRELVVPVFRGDKIVAILGVGNKPVDYTEEDVANISRLADLAWDITERRRVQEALQESEAFSVCIRDSLIEHLAVLDAQGVIIAVNRAWERFAEENGAPDLATSSLGMNYLAVCEKAAGLPHGEEAIAVRDGILSVLNRVRPAFSIEYPCDTPDEKRWFEIHVSPLRGSRKGVVVAHLNITPRKQAEAMILESEARYAQLAEQSSTVAWEVDAQGLYTYVSQGSEAVWGYRPDELINRKHFYDLHPEAGREAFKTSAFATFAQKQPFRNFANLILTQDGRQMWVSTTGTPLLNAEGALCGYRGSDTDITERKTMEEKLRRTERMEAIGTLASGVAHDLNNIIAPIILSAEMLRAAEEPEVRECLLSSIEECATRGAAVVNQVLTFAKGSKGERTTLQLRSLIVEMDHFARSTFPRNITITSSIPSDLWPVKGDPVQIHQVLLNLCINARDALPEGGALHLSAENREIDEAFAAMVPDAKTGDFAVLAVTDGGMGIPHESIAKIFEPFFTTKEVGRGTGLGLSSAMGIVRSHGGFLTVKSEVGRGTTFNVFLPRDTESTAEQKPLPKTEIPQERGGETLLVVDDERAVVKTLSMALGNKGYKVLTALDGNEALTLYKEQAHEIALVLTDVMMPGMDGVALSRALKRINPQVKIIASTGQASETCQAELKALGVNGILHKPYDSKKLLAALQDAIHAGGG